MLERNFMPVIEFIFQGLNKCLKRIVIPKGGPVTTLELFPSKISFNVTDYEN